jgi:uncharacterized membrane protein
MFFVLSAVALAQATENERKYTAFDMRSNGKIYVVVAVMLIIMLGLILYVVRIDRKITRLESKEEETSGS